MKRIGFVLLLSGLGACASADSTVQPTETNASGGESANPNVVAVTLPEPAQEPPETPEASVEGAAQEEPVEQAAHHAGTACERSYYAAIAVLESLDVASRPAAPARIEFVSRCEMLPTLAQHCMTMEFALANQEECTLVMQSAEVQAFRDDMTR